MSTEATGGGVRVVRPPSPDDPARYVENTPVESGFPAHLEAPEAPAGRAEVDHKRILDKFLSAKPRTEPDTATIYVPSLDGEIIVRELQQREADEILDMFAGSLTNRNKGGRGSAPSKTLVETNAHLVAKALVEPDLRDPVIYERFVQKFGHMSLPEMLMQIIKPFEIIAIGDAIMDLSGAGEDSIRVAKN